MNKMPKAQEVGDFRSAMATASSAEALRVFREVVPVYFNHPDAASHRTLLAAKANEGRREHAKRLFVDLLSSFAVVDGPVPRRMDPGQHLLHKVDIMALWDTVIMKSAAKPMATVRTELEGLVKGAPVSMLAIWPEADDLRCRLRTAAAGALVAVIGSAWEKSRALSRWNAARQELATKFGFVGRLPERDEPDLRNLQVLLRHLPLAEEAVRRARAAVQGVVFPERLPETGFRDKLRVDLSDLPVEPAVRGLLYHVAVSRDYRLLWPILELRDERSAPPVVRETAHQLTATLDRFRQVLVDGADPGMSPLPMDQRRILFAEERARLIAIISAVMDFQLVEEPIAGRPFLAAIVDFIGFVQQEALPAAVGESAPALARLPHHPEQLVQSLWRLEAIRDLARIFAPLASYGIGQTILTREIADTLTSILSRITTDGRSDQRFTVASNCAFAAARLGVDISPWVNRFYMSVSTGALQRLERGAPFTEAEQWLLQSVASLANSEIAKSGGFRDEVLGQLVDLWQASLGRIGASTATAKDVAPARVETPVKADGPGQDEGRPKKTLTGRSMVAEPVTSPMGRARMIRPKAAMPSEV